MAHVVTYISEDGAYGGPVAVARAQAVELAARAIDVELLYGWDGRVQPSANGVVLRPFRARRIGRSLSTLIAPGMVWHLARNARDYDVIHIHLGRDLVTMLAAVVALSFRLPAVLQTHGMVMPDRRFVARVYDSILTRLVLRRARHVLVLTEHERVGLEAVAERSLPAERIPNGIARVDHKDLTPRSAPPLVLFLARLHPRKQVMAFARMALLLREQGTAAVFRVVGPDEGDLPKLQDFIEENDLAGVLSYGGAIAPGSAINEFAQASVYVLPARKEVFPMTVLEALSAGTPVVLSHDCGIAADLSGRGAALVCSDEPTDLADAVNFLLTDGPIREQQIAAGFVAIDEWLSIQAVGERLEGVYRAQDQTSQQA